MACNIDEYLLNYSKTRMLVRNISSGITICSSPHYVFRLYLVVLECRNNSSIWEDAWSWWYSCHRCIAGTKHFLQGYWLVLGVCICTEKTFYKVTKCFNVISLTHWMCRKGQWCTSHLHVQLPLKHTQTTTEMTHQHQTPLPIPKSHGFPQAISWVCIQSLIIFQIQWFLILVAYL